MFEAYKIGVRIGVVDATGGGILKIAAQFATADKNAKGLLSTIEKINAATKRGFGNWADGAANAYERARRSAESYAASADRAARAGGMTATGGGGGGGGLVAMAAFAGARGGSPFMLGGPGQRLLGGSSGGAMQLGGPRGPGGGSWPAMPNSPGGGGLGPSAFTTAGWGWGGGGFGGGGGGTGFGGGFGGLIGGRALEQGGKAMFGMLGGPIDKASEYEQSVARFKLFGMSDELNKEAVKFANGMHIAGTSIIDAMNNLTEAQGVFRESGLSGSKALEGAKLAAPLLSKIAFATAGLDGESQAKMHTQSLAMLRFIEMRGGLKDASTFNGIADQGWKAIRSSGGNVDWEQMRQFMARGGVAAQGLNNEALFGKLEPVIGELKGSTAGNAWMTSYNRLVGGVRVPNQVAHLLADNGIWDKSKIEWNSQGGIKQFRGNPLKDMGTFASDPVEFYEKNILPMYAKLGITSAVDKGRENTMIFGRTGGNMFSLIDRQLAAIHHSDDAQKKALGIDDSVAAEGKTYRGTLIKTLKELETASVRLGAVVLPLLVKGLNFVTPLIEKMAKWIGDHSTLTKGLVIVFGALAGLAVVGGSLLAVGGALTLIGGALVAGGGLAVGLAAVGTALMWVSGVAAAIVAGAAAGGWLNDHAINPLVNKISGGKYKSLGDAAAGDGSNLTDGSIAYGKHDLRFENYVDGKWSPKPNLVKPGARGGSSGAMGDVYVDGKKLGKVMAPYLADQLSAPQRGSNSFDFTATPAPVGMTQTR